MKNYNKSLNNFIQTNDGSFSLYNEAYKDYYHSPKDGAILETLYKHIFPAFYHHLSYPIFSLLNMQDSTFYKNSLDSSLLHSYQKPLKILDICFGLGYNSLFSLCFAKRFDIEVAIYSPELDLELLNNLKLFSYPKILNNYLDVKNILDSILEHGRYEKEGLSLELFIGDAEDYVARFSNNYFNIIYQDAFSPSKNMALWSEAYFKILYKILDKNGIITTYSSASNIRNRARNAGFKTEAMKNGKLKEGSIFLKL